MHREISKIKKYEGKAFIIKNFLTKEQIKKIQKLYIDLPIEIDNKRQKILKKKWPINILKKLQKLFIKKLRKKIGIFKIDNPKTKDGHESFGLFQKSFKPVGLHVDTGFNFKKILFKQFLLPLSSKGGTVVFKNRFYGCSTTFSIDPKELRAKGFNKRSSQHLKIFKGKNFDKKKHRKYLKHENIKNLKGLEIEIVYKWKLGDILVFDRTQLHCSTSNLKNKKIGFTGLTRK
mgnify:FL=1